MRLIALTFAVALAWGPACAAEMHVVKLTLKDHRFTPSTFDVPAGETIRIELTNLDAALEEFDSLDLGVEKDVTPHGKVLFTVGPLKPGEYSFVGELHPDTPSGVMRAVAPATPSR